MVGFFSCTLLFLIAAGHLYWSANNVFDADTLLLPSIFRDCVSGHLNWFFWSLPPSRYIFPDVPVYFALRWMVGDGALALILNVWLNYLLLAFALAWAIKVYFDIPFRRGLLPVFFALTIATVPHLFPCGIPHGLFWPSYHSGAFIWSLLSLAVVGLWLRRAGWTHAAFSCVCSFFAGFCEPICFVTFVVPALAAVVFWPLQSPRSWRWRLSAGAGLLFFACLGSWFGDRLTPLSPLQFLHQYLGIPYYLKAGLYAFSRDVLSPAAGISVLIFFCGGLLLWWRWRAVAQPLLRNNSAQ